MNKEKISIANLLNSILLLVLGIILLTKSEAVISIIAWIFGGILLLFGLTKILSYFKFRKGTNEYMMDVNLLLGLLLISLGCVLIFIPGIVDVSIRVICGGWILIAGINRLLLGIAVRLVDEKGSKLYIITALLMILIGILVLTNLFNIIGIYIIIYAVFDIIGYIYSITTGKKIINDKSIKKEKSSKVTKKENKKIKKSVKERPAVDADIVSEKEK